MYVCMCMRICNYSIYIDNHTHLGNLEILVNFKDSRRSERPWRLGVWCTDEADLNTGTGYEKFIAGHPITNQAYWGHNRDIINGNMGI